MVAFLIREKSDKNSTQKNKQKNKSLVKVGRLELDTLAFLIKIISQKVWV